MRRRHCRSRLGLGLRLALVLGWLTGCGDRAPRSSYGVTLVELRMTSEAVGELYHGVYTETPVPCRAEVMGTSSRCQLRVAGSSSRDDLKKSFDVELGTAYAGRQRYRLSAMSGDPSALRTLLGLSSFAIAGLNVPRAEPVALWLNDDYLGLYLLLEPIDPDFFAERNDRVVALYKARRLRATLESTEDVEDAFARRSDDVNRSDLRVLIENIDLALAGQSHRLDELVDRNEVLRYMAGTQFVHNWDGIFNNYYLARSEHEPRFSILAWDLDQTYGGVLGADDGTLFDPNALMRFFYRDDHAGYVEELRRFDQLVTPEVFADWVDAFEATIGEAYRHDRLLSGKPLHEQAEELKRRAEQQHEVLSDR